MSGPLRLCASRMRVAAIMSETTLRTMVIRFAPFCLGVSRENEKYVETFWVRAVSQFLTAVFTNDTQRLKNRLAARCSRQSCWPRPNTCGGAVRPSTQGVMLSN